MTEGVKPTLTYVVIIGLVVILLVTIILGFSSKRNINVTSNTPLQQNTITVDGDGRIYATPDVFQFSATVSQKADSTAIASDLAKKQVATIIDNLKKAGVSEKDIQSSNISVYPNYWYDEGKSMLSGYTASHTISVKVRKIADAGSIMDQITALGDVQIQSSNYDIEDTEAVYEKAREKAFEKAHDKAKQLADLAGVRLGKVVSISTSVNNTGPIYPMYNQARAVMLDSAGGAEATNVAEGQMTFNATVNIAYEIK